MILFGDLKIRHYDIIWVVCPCVICGIIDSIGFTRKVNSLIDDLRVLVDKRTPLYRCCWPVKKIFVDEMIKILMILSPETVWIKLLITHFFLIKDLQN